jgi:cell division protein FtsW
VQSGEVEKVLLLVYLAGYLARFHGESIRPFSVVIRPVVVVSLLFGLLLLQPDFGTAAVLMVVALSLFFLAGIRLYFYFILAGLGALALAALAVLQPYRMQRLVSFMNPWEFAYGSGYQLVQSLIAFGRGEVFGLGLGEGIQKLDYLPEAHNDFIFAADFQARSQVAAGRKSLWWLPGLRRRTRARHSVPREHRRQHRRAADQGTYAAVRELRRQ